MKKCLIAIAMVLTLGMNADAAAQKHRHSSRTEQVDSTKNNQDAIEVFSDTVAATDAADAEDDQYIRQSRNHSDEILMTDTVGHMFDGVDREDLVGMFFALVVILIIFLLSPIGILLVIFYFINKNRRERYKLAQIAIQNGQPIADDLLPKKKREVQNNDDHQTGLRQMFMGIGLAVFLATVAGKIGFGIGALVFFLGLGKWYIARQTGTTGDRPLDNNDNSNHFSNNSNIKDND